MTHSGVRVRRGCLFILFTALAAQPSVAADQEPRTLLWLLERRVRIQSPVLGPGWREGLFNRQRREPPCYVVMIWKPRPSPESPLEVETILELKFVSELQAYSGVRAPVSTWAGLKLPEMADNSLWRPVSPDALNESKDCSPASLSK